MIRIAALIALLPLQVDAACRHALALGLDVSGSVDATGYRMQLDGLATALNSNAVQSVFFAQPDATIRILVYEWSGPNSQGVVLPWTEINSTHDLLEATQSLQNHTRIQTSRTTAIGTAMLSGFDFLLDQSGCWRRTLDLSGDGPSNTGPRPQDVSVTALPSELCPKVGDGVIRRLG